jgi:hypothetical protein
MAEQEEKNIDNFIENSLKSVKRLHKKVYKNLNLDLENENFTNNFGEIFKNPSSNYCNEIHLFSEIPNLKLQKDKLKSATESLNVLKEKLEIEINGDKEINEEKLKTCIENLKNNKLDKNAEDKIIEEIGLKNYQQFLKKEINGDDKAEIDTIEYIGFKDFEKNIHIKIENSVKTFEQLEKNIIESNKKYIEYNEKYNELHRKIEISENLKDLTLQAVKDKRNYYVYIFMIIFLLIMLSNYSYKYGTEIIKEIHKMDTRTSSDYFGFFLMKMPFSLIIIAFISGAFIFINKLLFIIERINNQLRNFSKISVIASQMDKAYIDLIKNGNFSNGNEAEQNAHKEAEQKNLFYKLITNYLVSLSKNEADLADSKKEPLLKQVKQIAGIVKEFNFSKDK